MKLDKSRFLAITGLLAAASGVAAVSACTITSVTGDVDGGNTTTDASTTTDGAVVDPPVGDASPDSTTTTDAADSAPSCLGDDKVQNPSCDSFADASTNCAGQAGTLYCNDVQAKFRNGVARGIMECLKLAPTCEAIPDPITKCTLDTLDKACPDLAATAAPCQAAAKTCTDLGVTPDIDQAKCQQYLAGLSPAGRTEFTSCAAEGCTLNAATAFCFVR